MLGLIEVFNYLGLVVLGFLLLACFYMLYLDARSRLRRQKAKKTIERFISDLEEVLESPVRLLPTSDGFEVGVDEGEHKGRYLLPPDLDTGEPDALQKILSNPHRPYTVLIVGPGPDQEEIDADRCANWVACQLEQDPYKRCLLMFVGFTGEAVAEALRHVHEFVDGKTERLYSTLFPDIESVDLMGFARDDQ